MDPVLVAAALGDGRDAGVLLEGGRVGEAVALLAEGGEQPRGEDAAGAGQIGEEPKSGSAGSDGRSRRRSARCRQTRRGAGAGAPRRAAGPAR